MGRTTQAALRDHRSNDLPPCAAGEQVVVTMRSGWRLVGEIRAVSDDAWRIFDPAVGEVLQLRPSDVHQVERLEDTD